MPSAHYNTKILEIKEIATNTIAVNLEKPVGFEYKAGQFINFTLPQICDKGLKDCRRSMSLASAPREPKLIMAMRISESLFKQSLLKMEAGDDVEIDGPFGRLIIDRSEKTNRKPVVLLAGGIGVTPFRGILLDEKENGWPRPITLIYGNRTPDSAAFLSELSDLENASFRMIPVMSAQNLPDWNGEKGRISGEIIKKHIKDLAEPDFYIVGQNEMVLNVHQILEKMGVEKERIRVELFGGKIIV